MKDPQAILITGASSGIGAALAIAYAKSGVTLYLLGRNSARLAEVASSCEQKGAKVVTKSLDIKDSALLRNWIITCDSERSLDLVIANAGISNAGLDHGEAAERDIFAVNLTGALNTVYPVIPLMKRRGRGQIVLMSSLAAMMSIARAPAYCASKSAVKVFGEALRKKLIRFGVEVSVICPGFVKTPLTDVNKFAMPFIMSAEDAAKIIMRDLGCNKGLIAFPWRMYFPLWLLRLLPHKLAERLTRHI